MKLAPLLIAAALTGCMPGPDYVRPEVQAPAAWRIDYTKAAEVAKLIQGHEGEKVKLTILRRTVINGKAPPIDFQMETLELSPDRFKDKLNGIVASAIVYDNR